LGLVIATKDGNAKVYLGRWSNSEKETFRMGRISFYIKWSYTGHCSYKTETGEIKNFQVITFMLFGPLLSLIFSIMLYTLLFLNISNPNINNIIQASAVFNFFQFLFTIIPIRYPNWFKPYGGKPSDGYQILSILKVK
jgi:hypothetical protein